MGGTPEIPFGYKLVEGRAEKGDGIWNGVKFERVKKEYPVASPERPIIRRCTITQPELPNVDAAPNNG